MCSYNLFQHNVSSFSELWQSLHLTASILFHLNLHYREMSKLKKRWYEKSGKILQTLFKLESKQVFHEYDYAK